jgi:hypothetical protein
MQQKPHGDLSHAAAHDALILERLKQARAGGPFIKHEDVKSYFKALARGEHPGEPQASVFKAPAGYE